MSENGNENQTPFDRLVNAEHLIDRDQLVDQLTLALIYLTSWQEKGPAGRFDDGAGRFDDGTPVRRAWKTYDWDALDRLEDKGFISFSRKAKSVYLTQEGAQMAEISSRACEGGLAIVAEAMAESMRRSQPISNEPAFEFKITLDLGPNLECWRQIIVPQSFTFADLHEAIQSSFLWWGYHGYDFRLRTHGQEYEVIDPDQGGIDMMFAAWKRPDRDQLDATDLELSQVFPRSRTATYIYDYGDGWEHHIKLVRTIDNYPDDMPVCTDGAGAAPPEDVGGPGGFENFLRVISDKSDPEHEDMVSWGEGLFFEPFDLKAVNDRMRKWRSGELFDEWDERNGDEDNYFG